MGDFLSVREPYPLLGEGQSLLNSKVDERWTHGDDFSMPFWLQLLISSSVISLSAQVAGKKPELAGWIMALPISSMIALALSHAQYQDSGRSVAFARSILGAIPLSLTFFVPFLFADRIKLSFWWLYGMGVLLLTVAFFAQQWWTRP